MTSPISARACSYYACIVSAVVRLVIQSAQADSATWLSSPLTNSWNNTANWTPGGPPNGFGEDATFLASNRMNISIDSNAAVGNIYFGKGASAYTITSKQFSLLEVYSQIANGSGLTQNFVAAADPDGFSGIIYFEFGATVGSDVVLTSEGGVAEAMNGGAIVFIQGSTAGNGHLLLNGGAVAFASGGYARFTDFCSAANASFDAYPGATVGGQGGFVQFADEADAGTGTFFIHAGKQEADDRGFVQFLGKTRGGNANFTVEGAANSTALPGVIFFQGSSTADHGTFNANGATFINEQGGVIQFYDNSRAQNGSFVSHGGEVSEAFGGAVEFFSSSNAGQASFQIDGGEVADAFGGRVEFFETSTAASAAFTLGHALTTAASRNRITKTSSPTKNTNLPNDPNLLIATTGSALYFYGNSSAGHASVVNYGGAAELAAGGLISFADQATAGNGTFSTGAGQVADGLGAEIYFQGNSTAGNGVFHTQGRQFAGFGTPRILVFDNATAGNASFDNASGVQFQFYLNGTAGSGTFTFEGPNDTNPYASTIDFVDKASAGSSNFTINGAANSTASAPRVGFFLNTTAENSHFTLNPGTVDGAIGARADFRSDSTAANSVFVLNGGPVDGAVGGLLQFFDTSTAGNATLIANDGAPGPRGGGRIFLIDDSTGGTAKVTVHGIGKLDLSMHNPGSVTVGSINGDGNVFLGSCELAVSIPSPLITGFSGVIQDGGFSGGTGGSLAMTGDGWLVLNNANTYSGGTSVNSGVLQVEHDGGLGTGDVSVESGAILFLDKAATNNYIADTAALKVVTGATVYLTFSGNPEVVASLIVDGVSQPGGLYGSTTSGAPHQLPQLRDNGTILVVNTHAVSRKAHGAAFFETQLPFTGKPAIECRSGGANGDYQIVVTFSRPVTFNSVAVTSGIASVQSTSGNNSSALTINLTGVADAQTLIVTLSEVNYGGNTGDITIPVSFLVGDTNGNGTVNASDVIETKAQSGQPLTNSNFREDITVNGSINTSDISLVKAHAGASLP